jgi:pimeloyl-ACP methyl ester carboxylesterase
MTIRDFLRGSGLQSKAMAFRLLFCVLVIALCGPVSANSQEPVGSNNPLKGELVDIGNGRHLNLICVGNGSPTVVFLQGLGGGITGWRKVRDPVVSITRSCFYDRAGFGYSDPSNQPSTAENVTNDLHALLHAAGIKGQIVLVGHSLGGLFATLYTDKFTTQVAGLVLVDPSFSNQFDYALPEARKLMLSDENQFITFLRNCQSLAKGGQLSRESNSNCFNIPSNATPEVASYLLNQGSNPAYYASGISEIESFFPLKHNLSLDGSEEHQRSRAFGDRPLIVLSAGNRALDSRLRDTDNNEMAAFLKQGHDALAARSTRGETIVVPHSGHDIHADKPDVVIDAIRKVVLQLRRSDEP